MRPDAVEALKQHLLPLAELITPNLPGGGRSARDRGARATKSGMIGAATALRALGPRAVLVKGGHIEDADSIDILDDGGEPLTLVARRVATANTHGTGCTLSSAIAALLGQGMPLREAVEAAKAYLTDALQAADQLQVGHGHGPVHHFHALWPDQTHESAVIRP